MTIRQLLVAGAMTVGSKITFKGSADAAATSISLPTHAAGDMIVIAAFGEDAPVVPDGWASIKTVSTYFSIFKGVVAYKVATGSSEVSGTWTDADRLIAAVYDGVASIGGSSALGQQTFTTTFPAVTLSETDGTSWVVGVGLANSSAQIANPPTGMTNRDVQSTFLALNDTASGVSAWNAANVVYGTSSSGAITFELVSE